MLVFIDGVSRMRVSDKKSSSTRRDRTFPNAFIWREFKKVNVKMFGALLFFFFLAASAQAFTVDEECLNYTIYPVQYDITIMPYIYGGHCFYECHITITVIANANINMIEMEAKNMTIKGESIQVLKGNQDIINKPRPYSYNEERGKLIIYLKEPLIPYKGNNQQYYLIRMNFIKEVTSDSHGVFLVKYIDENRDTK